MSAKKSATAIVRVAKRLLNRTNRAGSELAQLETCPREQLEVFRCFLAYFLLPEMDQLCQQMKQLLVKKPKKQAVEQSECSRVLASLSAELKFRMAQLVRRSGPNYHLWMAEWFFGRASEKAAERLLLGSERNGPGAFLITEGRGERKHEFVLSVLMQTDCDFTSCSCSTHRWLVVKHYRVMVYLGYWLSNLRSFPSLHDLVGYYRTGLSTIHLGRACAMPLTHEYAKWR